MDSITQLVLGGAVVAAVAGRSMGARKAVIVGGILGTLPDLDVFYPFSNPVDSFVLHRSITHSLLMHTIIAPIMGLVLARLLGITAIMSMVMVWLAWTTHALLDAMTVYGTQLLWPISANPFGFGSLFIIDPSYTLPLLVFFFVALFIRHWGRRIERGVIAALLLSTGYAAWSVGAQSWAQSRVSAWLEAKNLPNDRLLTTPMPFNTFFWRTIVLDGADYLNVYIPLLTTNDEIQAYRHPRIDPPGACALQTFEGDRLKTFAGTFVKALTNDQYSIVSDLRMGVTPNYVFNFAVSTPAGFELPEPIQFSPPDRVRDNDWQWLVAGILGQPILRKAEQEALVDHSALSLPNAVPEC